MRITRTLSICMAHDTVTALDKLARDNHLSRSAMLTQLVWAQYKGVDSDGQQPTKEESNSVNYQS